MKLIGYIFITAAILFLVSQWAAEWAAADMCLDAGRVYDYATSSCRSDVATLPLTRYTERFGWEILASLLVALLGMALVVAGRRK